MGRIGIAVSGMLRPRSASAVQARYERQVETFFGSGTALTYWKGRVALHAILGALGVTSGDEVIVPGYTCVMVPGAVFNAGATPKYVDIDPVTYCLDPDALQSAISDRTRAILLQHTYGLPGPVSDVMQIADRHGIPVIEDCCHTFGGRFNGQFLGTFGTAAFFSGQWNKTFTTGLGGIALVNEAALAKRMRELQATYEPPSSAVAQRLAAQLAAYELLVYPSVSGTITRVFRALNRMGLVIGSSSKQDFSPVKPDGFAMGASPVQCEMGLFELARIENNIAHRQRIALRYAEELRRVGFSVPAGATNSGSVLVRFPIRVANKSEALELAAKRGVEIGSWFENPLHPIETDQAAFGYQDGQCPNAEQAAEEAVNLPLHLRVSDRDVDRTLEFVAKHCTPVNPSVATVPR